MFENTSDLTISGKKFVPQKQFKDILKGRFNVLFGRNGSGKSTIAEAFRQLKEKREDSNLTVKLNVALTEGERNRIFVFDEEFVHSKVKVKREGLSSIVMLGNQVDIANKIDALEKEIEDKDGEIKKYENDLAKLSDDSVKNSSAYWKKELERSLKEGKQSWAEYERRIKKTVPKGRVTDELIESILRKYTQIEKNASGEELFSSEFERRVVEREMASEFGEISTMPTVPDEELDFEAIQGLLIKTVEIPQLSEREKIIFSLIKGQLNLIGEGAHFFAEHEEGICPYCFQNVDIKILKERASIVEHIINPEAKGLEEEISNKIVEIKNYVHKFLEDDLSPYEKYEGEVAVEIQSLIRRRDDFRKGLDKLKDALEKKLKSLHAPLLEFNETTNISSSYKTYIDELETVCQLLEKHNQVCRDLDNNRKILLKDNIKYAAIQSKVIIEQYLTAQSQEKALKETLESARQEKKGLEGELNDNKEKLRNTKIALDLINQLLNFIFLSPDRMFLESKQDESDGTPIYTLKIKGKDVSPEQISTGETNALALVYYFVSTFQNSKEDERYSRDGLYVIDDPVSSFDFEHRVGILALLHDQIIRIIKKLNGSKILILTHDMQTFFDLRKFTEEIEDICKSVDEHPWHMKILNDSANLEECTKKSFNGYQKLLGDVYDFAESDETKLSQHDAASIGNKMRRVAETLSTFLYGKGFFEILQNKDLYEKGKEKYKELYSNVMFRLVLNGESHGEEKTKSLNPFFEAFSPKTIWTMARLFLLLLLDTHPRHLEAMLEKGKLERIKQWRSSICTDESLLAEGSCMDEGIESIACAGGFTSSEETQN